MSYSFPILDDNERSPDWHKHSFTALPLDTSTLIPSNGDSSKHEVDTHEPSETERDNLTEVGRHNRPSSATFAQSSSLKRILVALLIVMLLVLLGGKLPGRVGEIFSETRRETWEWVIERM